MLYTYLTTLSLQYRSFASWNHLSLSLVLYNLRLQLLSLCHPLLRKQLKTIWVVNDSTNLGWERLWVSDMRFIHMFSITVKRLPSSAFWSHWINPFICSRKTLFPFGRWESWYHLRMESSPRTSAAMTKIHSGYFYSSSSSPPLLGGAPDTEQPLLHRQQCSTTDGTQPSENTSQPSSQFLTTNSDWWFEV